MVATIEFTGDTRRVEAAFRKGYALVRRFVWVIRIKSGIVRHRTKPLIFVR